MNTVGGAVLLAVLVEQLHAVVRPDAITQVIIGPTGGDTPRSPLLAVWMMSGGVLEKTGRELELSVAELAQDLRDVPAGHFVIRQRESDAIVEKLKAFERPGLPPTQRQQRINLREELRILTDREARAVHGVRAMLTDPDIAPWVLQVWRPSLAHVSVAAWWERLQKALGTTSGDFVNATLVQIQNASRLPSGGVSETSVNAVLAFIEGAAPKDEVEAALAIQMACTHACTMAVLSRLDGGFGGDRGMAIRAAAAARLLKAFATQVEALRRLRNGGSQFVRVEHVQVNDGGRAIVGNVSAAQRQFDGRPQASERSPPGGPASDQAPVEKQGPGH